MAALALAASISSGCQVELHRHAFDFASPRDRLQLDVWMRPPVGDRSVLLDLFAFPLEFVASTWTCATAVADDDLAITWGPVGWLTTALPFCAANQYADASRWAVDPARPEPQPFRVPVDDATLVAIRRAESAAERRALFHQAVRASLPPGREASPHHLDRVSWDAWVVPYVSAVDIAATQR